MILPRPLEISMTMPSMPVFRHSHRARIALSSTVLACVLSASVQAQSSTPVDPLEGHAAPVLSNHVLVVGTLTSKATAAGVDAVLRTEVEDTVRLYLRGKLDQWFFKPDDNGVVFIFNATDIKEVDAVLAALPLSRGGLMEFRTTRLAPLRPLGVLLAEPAR